MEKEGGVGEREEKKNFFFPHGSHHLMGYLVRKQEKEAPPVQRRAMACLPSRLFYGSEQ